MELFKLFGTIAISNTEANKALDETIDKASSIPGKISGKFEKIGTTITNIGTKMSIGLTVPLTLIGKKALEVSSDFEHSMSGVQAITGATSEEFEGLRELAIKLGGSTKYSASEVVYAMTEMAKAGWTTSQIMDGMQGVLDASAASGVGLATASTIVADAITGFGLSASESAKVADLLTQAANSGTISVEDLGETFKYISPVAKALGLSIEDVTTATTALSMSGIKGSQAGTSLRILMSNLVKPTDAMTVAIQKLGIETVNSDGSFKSLDEILSMLRKSFSNLTEEEKAYYGAVLAGKEGMSGLLALMTMTQKEYDAIAVSMDNCNGIAYETATIMQDNLKSKVEQFEGALESLSIKLSELAVPHMTKFVERLTNAVDTFTNLDPRIQKLILTIGGVAIAAGPVLTVVGKITSGIGGLLQIGGLLAGGIENVSTGATSLAGVGGKLLAGITSIAGKVTGFLIPAITSIGAPVAAVIAVIGGLIAIGVALYKNWDEICAFAAATWEAIKETISAALTAIGDLFTTIWNGIKDFLSMTWDTIVSICSVFVETLKSIISVAFEAIVTIVSGALELIKTAISIAFEAIKTVITTALEIIKNIISTAWEFIKTVTTAAMNAIKTIITTIWEAIQMAVTVVMEAIRNVVTTVWNAILSAVTVIVETIRTVIITAWEAIKSVITAAMEVIKSIISSAWETIKNVVTAAVEAIKSVITAAWEAIKTVISTVMEAISSLISTAWENIKSVVTSAVDAVKNTISNGINAAKDAVSNILEGIKNKFSSAFESIKSVVSGAMSAVKSALSAAYDGVSSAFNNVKSMASGAVSTVKNAFSNFTSKINLPSITSSGIKWNASAMNEPIIMNKPTIFGYDSATGMLQGGGEAGSEIVSGTDTLMRMISEAVASQNGALVSVLQSILKAIVSMDANMAGNFSEALDNTSLKVNRRELARIVKTVT